MLNEMLRQCRVLPVITAVDVASTLELSRTLQASGMIAVEITLRSASALDSIRALKDELPDLHVAAGTVTNPRDLDLALAAGAELILSPGLTPALLEAATERQAAFVPGVASASEIMQGMDYGLSTFKLFPAALIGGLAALKAFAGPFPEIKFCPTGGLNLDNFRDYLALPNVLCCGGSWMVEPSLVRSANWQRIGALAAEAMAADGPA